MHFYKYQGTGNDFIMIDDREARFPAENNDLVARLCDRKFGIGADGLILLQQHPTTDFYMKYYNSDGRESTMCGNGGRCIAAFAHHLGVVNNKATFYAIDGSHEADIEKDYVKLQMQNVRVIEKQGENTFVMNTGSPHFVQFISKDLHEFPVVMEAKHIRYGDDFRAAGINVNFVNLNGLKNIAIRTYERGVEDETLSCGTGVTAAALSTAILNNFPSGIHTIDVQTNGGPLKVQFNYEKNPVSFTDVWLQGPAHFVFEGQVESV